jgi:hypothetical protein
MTTPPRHALDRDEILSRACNLIDAMVNHRVSGGGSIRPDADIDADLDAALRGLPPGQLPELTLQVATIAAKLIAEDVTVPVWKRHVEEMRAFIRRNRN